MKNRAPQLCELPTLFELEPIASRKSKRPHFSGRFDFAFTIMADEWRGFIRSETGGV